MFRSLLLGLVIALGSVGAAIAQDCKPGAILDAYRKADAAAARKDLAAAGAGFRALAEQGLGPAQLRLGEILSSGAKPDPVEAYRWIALAADAGATGAKEALDALKPHLSAQQIAQAKIDPATWQPAQPWPCLAVDPRVKRPDGSIAYDLDRVVNHVFTGKTATGAPARREQWLARTLESVRRGSPRYLIYFKALNGIAFVGGPGPFVVVEHRDNLPVLVINESYADAVSVEHLQELVSAAIYAVGAELAPQVIPADVVAYKGFTIRSTTTEGGQRFVVFMKAAIDMVAQLPPELAALARTTTDLRYEPNKPYDKRGGAIALGMFARDPKTGAGYMSYQENFSMRGPGQIVMSLVDGGVFQRRAAGARKPGNDQRGDCEIEDYEIKTMEALKYDPVEINRAYNARITRGCS